MFNSSYVTVYLYKLKTVIKLHMVHLYSPNSKEEPELYEQGKTFVARHLLHRTVGVKLARVDDRNELVGRIYFTQGDIASEVLKSGLAKVSMPKDMNFDANYLKELNNAQIIG